MTRRAEPDLPVLFIAGKGRSGSTVLSMVLGELPGVVAGGELRFLWRRGLMEDRNCGCGRAFHDCPRWSDVAARLGEAGADELEMVRAHDRLFRWPAMPGLLTSRSRAASRPDVRTWAAGAGALYRALADETGARVVVDSSKWPTDPGVLGLVPGIRPVAVHLVRDPRAVAWSWQRRRDQHDLVETREMDRFGAWHSATSWMARNAVVEVAAARSHVPRVLVRYDDFVADPTAEIARISGAAEVELDPSAAIDGRTVRRSVNHTVAGNPARFGEGPLELRPDDEWRAALPRRDRRVVSAVTAPLRPRYGY